MISSFPDKWEEYDSAPRNLVSNIASPVREDILSELNKSDIFRKAYEYGGMKPEDFDEYIPVVQTLTSFIKVYEELKEYMG